MVGSSPTLDKGHQGSANGPVSEVEIMRIVFSLFVWLWGPVVSPPLSLSLSGRSMSSNKDAVEREYGHYLPIYHLPTTTTTTTEKM